MKVICCALADPKKEPGASLLGAMCFSAPTLFGNYFSQIGKVMDKLQNWMEVDS